MDFLDPKKERWNQFKLLIGYCLIALAIGGTALVLLYQAKGYDLNQQGQIIQNGLLFVSSQPSGSSIYLNNHLYPSTTSTRVIAPAGAYTLKITRPGYYDWQRPIYLAGGDVQHFDYPFLIPNKLQTSTVSTISARPTLVTQSPDRRWLLLDRPESPDSFLLYDLKNPKQPVATTFTLPSGLYTAGDGAQSWALEEWASDNRHVVLLHTYSAKGVVGREYIVLDRQTPSSSVNLTYNLNLAQGDTLSLYNNQTAAVYLYDPDGQTLERVNVNDGSVVSKLQHILAFKTYADKEILYVTDQSLNGKLIPGQVSVVLQDGQQSYTLRTLPSGASTYALNLAQYAGDWYVAVAASNDSSVYIYKDPQSQPSTNPDVYPEPWRRLPLAAPSYISFSSNTQFILAESSQNFAVYDLANIAQYRYTAPLPLDQPQTHAVWMDGDRIIYVSGGKLIMFDYDNRNQQALMTADPAYTPLFDSAYTHVYAVAPDSKDTSSLLLTSTWLLAPADQ